MPITDFKVNVNFEKKPPGLLGFGKTLIIGEVTGGLEYQEFNDLEKLGQTVDTASSIYEKAEALLTQENNPGLVAVAGYDSAATDGPTTGAELVTSVLEEDWYFLVADTNDTATVTDIADVIESSPDNGYPKVYTAQVASATDLTSLVTEYGRTFAGAHPVDEPLDAANVGENGSKTVGSITWKSKTLKGITAQKMKPSEVQEVEDANGYVYVTKAGDDVTSEGKMLSGEYIDVVHGLDWVQSNIEYKLQKIQNKAGKIPYDDSGVAMIESAVLSVLKQGYQQGIIMDDGSGSGVYSTDFKSTAESTEQERKNRTYNGGNFEFQLAGAIHEGPITGTVTY